MASAATWSSSTTMACILPPAATESAVSNPLSTVASSWMVPWIPGISPLFLSAMMASTAAELRLSFSDAFFSAWSLLYSASTCLYARSSSDSCFSRSASLFLASRIFLLNSSIPGPASCLMVSRLHFASLSSKSRSSIFFCIPAYEACASSDAASAFASFPWHSLRSDEHLSTSLSAWLSSSWSCLYSPPELAISSETSFSSAAFWASLYFAALITVSSSLMLCLSRTTSLLLLDMDSSKLSLKPVCSSMSSSAASILDFLVASSTLALLILSLRSLYSGPTLDAISSSLETTALRLSSWSCDFSTLSTLLASMRSWTACI